MALLIVQASRDPFSLSHFHLWFQWGFVFGSHELFSAFCPSTAGQLGELSKGPGQWQEVLSSKKRERPRGLGVGPSIESLHQVTCSSSRVIAAETWDCLEQTRH